MKADGAERPVRHSFHMRAINAVKRAGSIQSLVDEGQLTSGIMHALTQADVPYIWLAPFEMMGLCRNNYGCCEGPRSHCELTPRKPRWW